MRNKRIRSSITHQLAPLFRRVIRAHNSELAALDLRAVEAHILITLWDAGPLTVRGVQHVLGIRGSTLTGALDRLEKRELLRREAVPGDRRSYQLVPARWSKRKKDALADALDRAEDACYGNLSKAERAELLRLVTKANTTLSEAEQS
jgi:DNA-binding MarR family transcriptional regulator